MKKTKIFLASMALLCGAVAHGQAEDGDFTINVQMLPADCTLGDTVEYSVQILNLESYTYPVSSLLATISAPGNGKIIGFTDDGAAAGWQIVTTNPGGYTNGGGNSVTIRNTAPLGAYAETYPSLKVVATSLGTQNDNQTTANISRNLFGGFGYVPDDDQNNNSSGSALGVTAPSSTTPLHFLGINAAWKDNDGVVKWTVADETENDYFSIQRSFDGKKFEDVGRVKSIGNHKDVYTYSFNDVNVKAQTTDQVFYRVKQVDISGRSTSTTIVKLTAAAAGDEAYIFPNPVKGDRFNFVYQNINIKEATNLDIKILDAHGRLIQSTNTAISNGKNQIELSTQGLAAGTYFLNYSNDANNIKGSIRVMKD